VTYKALKEAIAAAGGLATANSLANALDVSHPWLSEMLNKPDAPSPVLHIKGRLRIYVRNEVLEWWKETHE